MRVPMATSGQFLFYCPRTKVITDPTLALFASDGYILQYFPKKKNIRCTHKRHRYERSNLSECENSQQNKVLVKLMLS
jgi:hypothetical protein